MGSTKDLLQIFSSAESRSLDPECSNSSTSFRPKLLSRSPRDRSTFLQQQNLNQKTIPISRVVECCLSLGESTCFLRQSETTSGKATSIRSNTSGPSLHWPGMVTEKSVRATLFAWFSWKRLLLKSHLSGLKT